jgi:hypothetical protein
MIVDPITFPSCSCLQLSRRLPDSGGSPTLMGLNSLRRLQGIFPVRTVSDTEFKQSKL